MQIKKGNAAAGGGALTEVRNENFAVDHSAFDLIPSGGKTLQIFALLHFGAGLFDG